MYIDMHIHTVASDGVYDIDDVIDNVREKNVKYFSTADHDANDTSKEMYNRLKERNITDLNYIPGIEFSTTFMKLPYHVLFYTKDIDNPIIRKHMEITKKHQKEVTESVIEKIAPRYNGIISKEEFVDYTYDKKQGGFKIINYLISKGIVTFDEFFSPEWRSLWDVYNYTDIHEVINDLKKIDGKIILAHPSYFYRDSYMPEEVLDELREIGIDGVECYSPYSKEEFFNYYVDYCKRNNLLITCGSDSHGSFTAGREIGKPQMSCYDENFARTLKEIYGM